MIGKILGFILQILHGILIFGLWLSPFYVTNRYWLLFAIALQSAILAHQHFFDKRCVLTMLEHRLCGDEFTIADPFIEVIGIELNSRNRMLISYWIAVSYFMFFFLVYYYRFYFKTKAVKILNEII